MDGRTSRASTPCAEVYRALVEAQRVTEAEYREVLARVGAPAALVDAGGRVVFANETLAEHLGTTASALVGGGWWELCAPAEEREALRAELAESLARVRAPRRHEGALGAKGERFAWCYTLAWEGSAPRAVAAVGEPRRERSHQALMEQASDGIFVADPDLRYEDVNPRGCEMLGYTREELIGKSITEVIAPEDLARTPLRVAEMQGGATVLSQRLLRRKDGTTIPVEISARKLEDGHYQSIVRDVTERRHAEEALRRSEANFRTLIEQVPEMVVVHRAGRVVYGNPAALRGLGCERPEEIVGRPVLELVHPDDRPLVLERIKAMTETGRSVELRQERMVRRDGTSFSAEVAAFPVVFDGVPAILAVGRDVTEQKLMQARLAQADRMASVGVLAAGVAHEINNPLTYVLLNLDRLVAGLQDEALASRAREAAEGARRVQKIVRDLRSFARADEDERTPVWINDVLDTALDIAANEIRFRAKIVRDYNAVAAVLANEGRLLQVFLNLLVNAAHAIDEGNVEGNEIRVRSEMRGREVRVEVRDTGRGIPRGHMARLFDPFFTTKPVGMGSGLGLWICHNIVTSYDGRIEVESTPGRGSTFAVTLPAAAATERRPSSAPEAPPPVPRPQRLRVLVVDDEPMIRTTLVALLARRYEAVEASSGAEARALLERDHNFDVVLCDLMMPDVSGIDLHDWLSARMPDLARRMVLMTGGAFTERASEFLDRVPNPRIEKPFEFTHLLSVIEQVQAAR